MPRVIRSDVFQQAQDLTRAGERIFIARRKPSKPVAADLRDALALNNRWNDGNVLSRHCQSPN